MKRIFTLGALLGAVVICSGTMTAITSFQADTREYTYTIQDAHNLQDFPLAKPTSPAESVCKILRYTSALM